MPTATIDNVSGHRAKYDLLMRAMPAQEAEETYVGGGDPILAGLRELEAIRACTRTDDATVIDIGCGIGRLTQHMVYEPIRRYVGLDIIPEILQSAKAKAQSDARFRFALSEECKIPEADASADIVVAFSVITHLIDEEIFEYLSEARRVLKPTGVGIFSFLDFYNPHHQSLFFRHASQFRGGHGDMLKFNTQDVLRLFGERAGFRSVEFVDGSIARPMSGRSSRLIDVGTLPPTYTTGQSVCFFSG
jgi:ubiquinone/menaquinone biosynthesis C-methylase UbiE